jgi:hypothetical protein
MEFLIQPTTDAARSTAPIGIPHYVWSPVDARNTTITPTGNSEYPGAERAPRKVSVMLVRSRQEDLPADAEVFIQVLVYPAVVSDGIEIQPAVYQTIATLTPENLEWTRDYPIDPGLLSIYKEASNDAYGVVSFGMFSSTISTNE